MGSDLNVRTNKGIQHNADFKLRLTFNSHVLRTELILTNLITCTIVIHSNTFIGKNTFKKRYRQTQYWSMLLILDIHASMTVLYKR